MWEQRYTGDEYLFGKEPAAFLVAQRAYLRSGAKALVVADGEGRNSVYVAQHGLDVTAMDYAPSAVRKAQALAAERGVAVDFRLADIMDWEWQRAAYDLVVAVFIQFVGPDLRTGIFEGMKTTLRPGGTLMLHGYTPEQVDLGTGGPPFRENMYTSGILAEAFADFETLRLEAYEAVIREGTGHAGQSALIDYIGRKK